MDDSELLAQANDMIQQQQKVNRESSDSDRGMRPVGAIAASILAKINSTPTLTPEQASAVEQRRQSWLDHCETQDSHDRVAAVVGMVGRRYADSTLDTFQASSEPQAKVLALVRDYVANIHDRIRNGVGLFLIGPPGTGKDHLVVAVLKAAAAQRFKVLWTDGMELFAAARDNIDTKRTEESWTRRYTSPDVLAISDPVPPLGDVKEGFQISTLFSIIDRRYREMKPTLMTLNVADREEAEKRMSANIVDRLAHGALVLRCNWPSYRK